jgi:hypothetical protein
MHPSRHPRDRPQHRYVYERLREPMGGGRQLCTGDQDIVDQTPSQHLKNEMVSVPEAFHRARYGDTTTGKSCRPSV